MSRKEDENLIVTKLAAKYGLTKKEISTIVNSQFETVRELITSDTFKSIKLPALGKFMVNKKKLRLINHSKQMENRIVKESTNNLNKNKNKDKENGNEVEKKQNS